MIFSKIFLAITLLFVSQIIFLNAFGQVGVGDSPFERKFGDVKFLDAYFGTMDEKMEVNAGDKNVPFTVVFSNVGTQDITGIKGQLSMPIGFSASDGPGALVIADADSNSLAGENFHLTFFVNLENSLGIGQYPASVKVDYSRLRESGVRNTFLDFNFKVTGDSIINMRAVDPFLTSLKQQTVIIEISNDGTAPVSGVDIELKNTQSERASTSQSITNVENVVILNTNWDIGHIEPGETKFLEATVYVPESLKGDTLRAPMDITYFNAHGDQHTISRIVDFYVKGFIDTKIYNVDVIELSDIQTVIGEIINEGNQDALFGFVTIEPLGDSNIKKNTQFIDEIETDSPVPFNMPVEFDGEPKYGEHEVRITVRYKDDLREEHFVTYDATVFLEDTSKNDEPESDYSQFLILPIAAGVGILAFTQIRKHRQKENSNF